MKFTSFLALLLVCLLALAAIIGYGHYRIEKKTDASRGILATSVSGAALDPEQWSVDLPGPVGRYFTYALGKAENCPPLMETTTTGSFLLPLVGGEHPIHSRQLSAIGKTAYVHDAKVTLIPGIWIRFLDVYRQNDFETKKYFDSLVDIKAGPGTASLESFLLGFWLLTAPLNPAALLGGERVSWQEIDENSAQVTVTSPLDATISATVVFNGDGGVKSLELREPLAMLPDLPALRTIAVDSYAMQNTMMAPTRFSLSGTEGGKPVAVWHGQSTIAAAK